MYRYATDKEILKSIPELGVTGIQVVRDGCTYELCPLSDEAAVWVELVNGDGEYQIVRPHQLADLGFSVYVKGD